MTQSISRSDLLRGRINGKGRPLRPPWSIHGAGFLEQCTQCGDCIKECPTKIIQRGRAGYPVIDFKRGECLFCGDCVDICDSGALRPQDQAWSLRANIENDRCLAHQRVECRACADQCEVRAIEFQYRVGAVAIPVLDASLCNGCGACYAPCPVNAIEIAEPMEVAA